MNSDNQQPDTSLSILGMDAVAEIYTEAVSTYRFYHEYRMNILNYTLTFNAALMVIAVEHIKNNVGRSIIGSVAVLATLLMLGFEIRTVNFANNVWDSIIELEVELKHRVMTNLRAKANQSGLPQRVYVRIFYGLLILVWMMIISFAFVGLI